MATTLLAVQIHSSGARVRYDQFVCARYVFDWNKQFELSLDSEGAKSNTMKPSRRYLEAGRLLLEV